MFHLHVKFNSRICVLLLSQTKGVDIGSVIMQNFFCFLKHVHITKRTKLLISKQYHLRSALMITAQFERFFFHSANTCFPSEEPMTTKYMHITINVLSSNLQITSAYIIYSLEFFSIVFVQPVKCLNDLFVVVFQIQKHLKYCSICSSGKACYELLQA